MLIALSDIIKTAWKMYTENFKLFMRVTAWGLLVPVALSILAFADQMAGVAFYNYSMLLYIALSALSIIIMAWVYLVTVRLIESSFTHAPLNLKEVKSLAWHDIISYFWVSVLVGIAVTAGLIVFIIPGIIFGVWFAFATVIFALYRTKGRAALLQSKKLVRGRFWPVLWRVAIPQLIYIAVVGTLIGLISFGIGALTKFSGFNTYAGPWWNALANAVPSLVFLPLSPAFLILVLHSLEHTPAPSAPAPRP